MEQRTFVVNDKIGDDIDKMFKYYQNRSHHHAIEAHMSYMICFLSISFELAYNIAFNIVSPDENGYYTMFISPESIKLIRHLEVFSQYNIDIRLAFENREYWQQNTYEEFHGYLALLMRLLNGGILPITAFEYAADESIFWRISIFSKYMESNTVIQNHNYWYELEEVEFESYFERFISMANANIEPVIALQYADDYQDEKSIEELITFKNKGLDTQTAWLLTNTSNELVAAFFEFMALGFDENYAFECANEFYSYPEKKAYVIHLANMGINDFLAYNIVHHFFDDKINLRIIECAMESKEKVNDVYETLIENQRAFPSQ